MVSFFYPYPTIFDASKFEGIKIADYRDITAMKIITISQRAKKKDYFDIVEILKHIAPEELKTVATKKYGSNQLNWYHILKSLFYFEDVKSSPEPLKSNTNWEEVQKTLLSKRKELEEIFLFHK